MILSRRVRLSLLRSRRQSHGVALSSTWYCATKPGGHVVSALSHGVVSFVRLCTPPCGRRRSRRRRRRHGAG